jgi:hypothetical protein
MAKPKGKGSHAASVEAADKHPGASRGPTPSAAISRPDALDRFFALSAKGTNIATEFRAGLATFLTMAYIMFVNPAILEKAGMDVGAVFVASCLARSRHGAERLFCLYRRAGAWRQLAACARVRVHLRRPLFRAVAFALARLADRCASDEFEARHRRRHWTVPCSDRLATCGHCGS